MNRVVRDAGQIYEEIVSHFVTAGVPVRVTIEIESEQLAKLSDDQRSAIRENLRLSVSATTTVDGLIVSAGSSRWRHAAGHGVPRDARPPG